MPRKERISIARALELLRELPSDSELSDFTDSSDTEEYTPDPIGNSEDDVSDSLDPSDDDDDPVTVHQPGPSTQPQVPIWNHKQMLQKTLPDFTAISGPNEKLWELDEKTPIAIFQEIFSPDLMEHIVFETNLYATQKGNPFTPLTLVELLIFLGINLLMGIKRLPSYKDYWANEEALRDEFISRHMSCRRFSWILGNLHLNNNILQPKRGEENFDRLYKVRPLLDHLSKTFLEMLHPSKNQAIDESMIKFKGRSSIKQYMPKKPIKRGFKVWMRCDESGYACQFEIYSGKQEVVEKNLAESVVKRLTECLHDKNHRVFMDNYFTTYELFRYLETENVYACGTVMINRKYLPKTLLAQDRDLARGDFDWAVSSDNLFCLKWKDKRCVTLLSSLPDAVDSIQIERKQKDGTKVLVNCPKAIPTYNSNMGFVDKFDQLVSLYEVDRKSKKWWHRIFFHFLDAAVINSYILHKLLTGNEIKITEQFRLSLLYSLCAMKQANTLKRRLPYSPENAPKFKVKISQEKRYSNVDHMPVKGTSRRCAYCSTKAKPRRTSFMCKTCNIGLCFFQKGVTCFQKFHEDKK